METERVQDATKRPANLAFGKIRCAGPLLALGAHMNPCECRRVRVAPAILIESCYLPVRKQVGQSRAVPFHLHGSLSVEENVREAGGLRASQREDFLGGYLA